MALLNVVAALISAVLLVQGSRASEHQLQAVFLFNFAQFVDWQPVAAQDPRTPLRIGILGDDPFGAFLDETVRDERLGLRPFEVRRYRDVKDIAGCNILHQPLGEQARRADSRGAPEPAHSHRERRRRFRQAGRHDSVCQ